MVKNSLVSVFWVFYWRSLRQFRDLLFISSRLFLRVLFFADSTIFYALKKHISLLRETREDGYFWECF